MRKLICIYHKGGPKVKVVVAMKMGLVCRRDVGSGVSSE